MLDKFGQTLKVGDRVIIIDFMSVDKLVEGIIISINEGPSSYITASVKIEHSGRYVTRCEYEIELVSTSSIKISGEKSCNTCSRMNDIGVHKCWWCEGKII